MGGVSPCSAGGGTTIQVRDLFYKLPARRKFLKTANTEGGHIAEHFTRIALANCDLDMTLTHNDRELHRLGANPVVEIWGDGRQRRSFMHASDCVEGLVRLMESDYDKPLNLGRSRVVTINELVDIIAGIAGVRVEKKYVPGSEGVRVRYSDNRLCKEKLGWEPSVPLEEGLVATYRWIESLVSETYES